MSWETGKAEESGLTMSQASSAGARSKPGIRALRDEVASTAQRALELTMTQQCTR